MWLFIIDPKTRKCMHKKKNLYAKNSRSLNVHDKVQKDMEQRCFVDNKKGKITKKRQETTWTKKIAFRYL